VEELQAAAAVAARLEEKAQAISKQGKRQKY
jgi:hypothetical protein